MQELGESGRSGSYQGRCAATLAASLVTVRTIADELRPWLAWYLLFNKCLQLIYLTVRTNGA
jgi:hypothetical protein